jgi:hypothetical protein
MTQSTWIKIALAWMALGVSWAAVLDRIAVTVGNEAITESEVIEEIRITSFLNNEPLDFSPAARRVAADRLVDQYLIRHELEAGSYPSPDQTQATKLIADFTKTHFPGRAEFEKKLKQYGITEEDLASHLRFQLQAIQFTDLRFAAASSNEAYRTATPAAGPPTTETTSTAAPSATDPAAATKVDQQLDDWLKQVRTQTRIEFKKEAFE